LLEPGSVALSEVYRFAGVEYRLHAIVDGPYFFGRWRCGVCELEGGSDAKYAYTTLAIFTAKSDLAQHHKIAHRGELSGARCSE
jgi:hypothetical protein